MFYDLQLLSARKNGKFALLWNVATCRSSLRISKAQYLSINIDRKGEEVMVYIGSSSGNPKQRFSLYLSAQLTYGLTYIYYRQLEYLLYDVLHTRQYVHSQTDVQKKKKVAVRRLTNLSQAEIDNQVQRNVDNLISALPNIDDNLLLGPSENAVQDQTSIQIRDEVPPFFNESHPTGDFGDIIWHSPGMSLERAFPFSDAAINNIVEDESHQQITITADIHPVPPENVNTEVPSIDPIALNTHEIQPSAEKIIRNVNLDEIIQLPAKINDTRNIDSHQIIAEIDTDFGPKSKSTPLPTSRPQESVPAQIDTGTLHLDSQIDNTPVPKRGQKRKGKTLLIDEEIVIPSDIFKSQITEKVELQLKRDEFDLILRVLKFNNQDLFHVPAHNNIMQKDILKLFSWECAGRRHADDILDEILGIRSGKNINPDSEASGHLSSISSIGTPHVSGRSTLPRSAIPNIIDNRLIGIDEPEVLQEPRPILETIREGSDIRESVKSKVSAQKVSKASDKLNKITEKALPIPEPELPHEQRILQDSIQAAMEPLPSCSQENESIQEESLKQSTEVIKTKRNQLQEEILARLNLLWNTGLDEIPFLTLCPPNKTTKLEAAYTFHYLLDLHKQKKVVLLSQENSITIGYIRKV